MASKSFDDIVIIHKFRFNETTTGYKVLIMIGNYINFFYTFTNF